MVRRSSGWGRAFVAGFATAAVVLSGLVVGAGPAQAVANRTVAFWSLDEPAGSGVLVDSSGNGHNGTIGTDIATGTLSEGATVHRYPTVLPAEQTEHPQHVDRIPHSPDLNPDAGDFSFEIRFRTSFSFGNFLQKGQGGTAGGYFKLQAPGGVPGCLFRGADGSSRTGYSTTPVNDGQWHTIRCVRTATYVEMYVDGVRTSRANGPTGTISNTWGMTIGGKGTCDGVVVTCDYFAGDVDYVRVEKGSTTTGNAAPTASFTTACTGLVCSLDASASGDADGAVQRHTWSLGDGTTQDTVSVPRTTVTYAEAGTYEIGLTVTDDRGAATTTTRTVEVAPVPEKISFVDQASSNVNATAHQVVVPAGVQAGDQLLMVLSQNTSAARTVPAGWTQVQTQASAAAPRTTLYRRTATAADAGSTVRVTLTALSKVNLVVAAYRGVDPLFPVHAIASATDTASTAARTTPTVTVATDQAWALSYWMHGDGTTTALTPPPGVTVRASGSQTGSGRVTGLLADSGASVPRGTSGGRVATAAAASTTTTTWTLALAPEPPPNTAPVAALDVTCTWLVCDVSGAGSSDLDGRITSYAVDLGDGSPPVTSADPTLSATYPAAGSYTVSLTVTDERGATSTATQEVTVAEQPPNVDPTAGLAVTCDALVCTASAASSSDPDGALEQFVTDFGDGSEPVAGVADSVTHTYAVPGTYTVRVTVTDDRGGSATTTQTATAVAVTDVVSFVGQATANLNSTAQTVTVPAAVQAGDALVLVLSTATQITPGTPTNVTGWTQHSTVDGGQVRTTLWSKVATATDAGRPVRITLPSTSKTNLVLAAYRGTDPTTPVLSVTRAGVTTSSTTRTTPTTTVPTSGPWALSYWAHKDSGTTALTPPPGVTVRSSATNTGTGRVTGLLADSGAPLLQGSYGGLTATAAAATNNGTTWTVLLRPLG